ncbi:hypothetical protein [Metabacillus malikii]|uniref:Uncharacterized protein YfcZ (UPF0381/DUF406 family) n=1 Tax=Metabacillus malikii TaxID=1504265 RepID=A0ABT9ZHA9_9BACI|nr:hypothetical protein [Metabacillus malikii]MDQ0231661.1 uncharacterized protein YfcZ (UPF0381/DUF406 family) [Metabacillus malikii]
MSKYKMIAYLPCFLIILSTGLLSACVNKEVANGVEQYELKEEEIKYKGYLSPTQTKIIDVEESKLIVKNGNQVKEGEVLTEMDEKVEKEVQALIEKRKKVEGEIAQLDKNISEIKKGNYSVSPELSSEVEGMQESLHSQDYIVEELELNLEEINYNYKAEKENLNRSLNENNNELTNLKHELETLRANRIEASETEHEAIMTIESEIKSLEQENEEIKENLQTLEQTYKFNEARTKQSLQNSKESKGLYEKKYQNIKSGNTNDPSVKAVILQLEEEKKSKQDSIEELNKTIASYEEESMDVAPFDGQISITSTGQVAIHSNVYQFVFNATERQIEEVQNLKPLHLKYQSEVVGELTYQTMAYNEELSTQGQTPIYKMLYDIKPTSKYKPIYHATAYMVHTSEIHIPQEYVGTDEDNKHFVLINGKKKNVKVEKVEDDYLLIEGAEAGDVIEKVVDG